MYNNTCGSYNTAYGRDALSGNTTASDNTAVGYQAGYSNTTGTPIQAYGKWALYANTTGTNNDAFGFNALGSNTTGSNNSGFGTYALYSNTTASYNTAVGYQAGYTNAQGSANTFVGYTAGYSFAGSAASTYNTFIGYGAGYSVTTGTKNTIIGTFSGNQGGFDIRTASNYIFLSDGEGNVRANQGGAFGWYQYNNSASWSTTSDQRIKENIVSLENGLNTICALRPVEFDYKIKDKKHDIGFIAQEYETVLPDQVHTESSISAEIREMTDGEDIKVISPNLLPYLVKAIQELKAEFDAYKATHP